MKNIILLSFIIALSIPIITSCEDDPLIEPEPGSKPTGGSYARLSFPDSTEIHIGESQ